MVKVIFWHVGAAICAGDAAWCAHWNILYYESKGVTVPNIKSLPLLVSDIWTIQYLYAGYAVFMAFVPAIFEFKMANV